uniref:Uncharacterized protein n=1 Tax=Anguilla anguilla TaxID=7936 RepID=A0A0E9QMK8_ANGAN
MQFNCCLPLVPLAFELGPAIWRPLCSGAVHAGGL